MTVQYIILGIVLLASIGYAIWRIYKAMSVKSGDPCYGCALKDACNKYKKKEPCDEKLFLNKTHTTGSASHRDPDHA